MKKFRLSMLDRTLLEDKLNAKYQKIGNLKVQRINVFQLENGTNNLITIVRFYYGFLEISNIEFRYYNDELFTVAGYDVTMKFIDEMKSLLKEYRK